MDPYVCAVFTCDQASFSGVKKLSAEELSTRDKGDAGEDAAVEYLLSNGYSVINRNYRSKKGEIDCIAKDENDVMVFIEVKSAKSLSFGNPVLWVTPAKQKTIIRMAQQYLFEHRIKSVKCRFDVITVIGNNIKHIKNAFTG